MGGGVDTGLDDFGGDKKNIKTKGYFVDMEGKKVFVSSSMVDSIARARSADLNQPPLSNDDDIRGMFGGEKTAAALTEKQRAEMKKS